MALVNVDKSVHSFITFSMAQWFVCKIALIWSDEFAMCVCKARIIYNADHMNLNIQAVNFQVQYLSISKVSHKISVWNKINKAPFS